MSDSISCGTVLVDIADQHARVDWPTLSLEGNIPAVFRELRDADQSGDLPAVLALNPQVDGTYVAVVSLECGLSDPILCVSPYRKVHRAHVPIRPTKKERKTTWLQKLISRVI